jgi:amino acid transporter
VRSILTIVVLSTIAGLLSLIGTGNQEAYQLIIEGANLCFGIYYMLMFLVPLTLGRRGSARPPIWLRAAALSGLIVTLLAMGYSLVPIISVPSKWIFAAKIAGTAAVINLLAVAVYKRRVIKQI